MEKMTNPEIFSSIINPEVSTQQVIEGLDKAKMFYSVKRPAEQYGGPPGYSLCIPGLDDAGSLKELYQAAFPGYPFGSLVHTEEGHRQFLQDSSQIRIVLQKDGCLIAAAALGTIPPDLSGEIKQVVVRPSCRGQGLNIAVINALVDIGEIACLQYLYMDVRARMIQMQKTALRAGFRAVGFRIGQHIVYHPDIGPRREHMIHMVKFLNGAESCLDEDEHQKIEPEIISQLEAAGLDLATLRNNIMGKT